LSRVPQSAPLIFERLLGPLAEIDAAISIIRERSEMSASVKTDLIQAIDTLVFEPLTGE